MATFDRGDLRIQMFSFKNLTIFGHGKQTRSFCYVDDTVNGLLKLAFENVSGPVNIGSTEEISINKLAKIILKKLKSNSRIIYATAKEDEPTKRCPSIVKMNNICGWEPSINLDSGLEKTINITIIQKKSKTLHVKIIWNEIE